MRSINSHSNSFQARSLVQVACAMALAALLVGLSAGQALALDVGDTFKKDGNTYKVTEAYENSHEIGEALLVKYGSTNKTPSFNIVKYKGESFEVERIGHNAFNNAKGHKITSVKLGKHVDAIGKKAFYGCTKLKTIDLAASDSIEVEWSKKVGKYVIDDLDIGEKAFTKAGVAKVKVKCGCAKASFQKVYKKALVKKGLRTDAKVVK